MTESEAIKGLTYLIGGKSNQYPPDYDVHIQTAIKALEEVQKYRIIGTVEEFRKSADLRKRVTEIVDRQLIAGKNNFKETYDCFWKIAKVVQDNY